MQQFIVPQFIDIESKILGPITVRQFIISLIGGFFIVISYKLFDTGLFVLSFIFISAIVIVFGFIKVNGVRFHIFLGNFITSVIRPNIRVWRPGVYDQDDALSDINVFDKTESSSKPDSQKKLTKTRLQELALIVDTGGMYKKNED